MTLKIYVARDSKDREWPPNTPHEAEACEWMLKKAWMEFHHLQEMYAIVVNLKDPSADLVVIREIGLGVMEMKHHPGEIAVDEREAWWAGNLRIHSGNRRNPREQVRSYARQLRGKMINELLPARMRKTKESWNDLKFQTSVCFTNPSVDLRILRKFLEEKPTKLEPWEKNFSILEVGHFTGWVRKLRFELSQNPPEDYAPIHLEREKIVEIATKVLDAGEWEEMMAAMPDGNPYGHLVLEDVTGREVFNLTKDHLTIGRSHQCDIVIPSRYGRVSKRHLAIDRDMRGIIVKDLSSMNGTFLNNDPLEKPQRLINGSILFLGGLSAEKKACKLTFELHGEIPEETVTEQGTQVFGKYAKKQRSQ